ncbi:DUF2963 domain-containing protein [Candidatus Phytoplasma pruni]|uniref:DUF2963 domain-containing protein n=1 Tax=Candidatus Phytoplasma pruni TaxID=479893 RepID=A0A851HCT6_9MOLU|nr:hypothetical protein [Candidatus Phytoplasma pruni]NWN45881.1 hypothetical protein [Candidatus Phytoplasma pruni]
MTKNQNNNFQVKKTTTYTNKNGYKTFTAYNKNNRKIKKTSYYPAGCLHSISYYDPQTNNPTKDILYYYSGDVADIFIYDSQTGKPTKSIDVFDFNGFIDFIIAFYEPQYGRRLSTLRYEKIPLEERQLALQEYQLALEIYQSTSIQQPPNTQRSGIQHNNPNKTKTKGENK